MKDNLELWGKVERTNPSYTKNANVKGNKITSISPQYQIQMVTAQFGVYGREWGFKNIEIGYELLTYDLVTFKATFFFPDGEFEIINSIQMFMDRAKEKVDDNFAKKLETDTLTKAISKLGFNADIFMGKFDDQRYVNELKEEFKEKPKPIVLTDANIKSAIEKGTQEDVLKGIESKKYKATPEQIKQLEK